MLYRKRMSYVEEQVFNTDETGLFYKDIDYNIIYNIFILLLTGLIIYII